MKIKAVRTSSIISTFIVIASIALSIYNYNRLLKINYEFAKKENLWQQKYQNLEDKLKLSNDSSNDFQRKIDDVVSKSDEYVKNLYDLKASIAQIETLQNADNLMAMQFKHIITMAAEQLKITQDAGSTLFTLQSIDDRLQRFPAGYWADVRQALANDIMNLKLQPSSDLSSILERLNKNIFLVDRISLMGMPEYSVEKTNDENISWFKKLTDGITSDLLSLVRIRKINNPDSVILSKEQEWFVKENLKLLLQQAKMAAYHKNQQDFSQYLQQVLVYSQKYMDKQSKNADFFNKNIQDLGLVRFANNININQSLQAIYKASAAH